MATSCCVVYGNLRVFIFVKIINFNLGCIFFYKSCLYLHSCFRLFFYKRSFVSELIYIGAVRSNISHLWNFFPDKPGSCWKRKFVGLYPDFIGMTKSYLLTTGSFKDHSQCISAYSKITLSGIAEIFCAGFFYHQHVITPDRRCLDLGGCICDRCFYIEFCCTVCSVCIQSFILSCFLWRCFIQRNICCLCIDTLSRKLGSSFQRLCIYIGFRVHCNTYILHTLDLISGRGHLCAVLISKNLIFTRCCRSDSVITLLSGIPGIKFRIT